MVNYTPGVEPSHGRLEYVVSDRAFDFVSRDSGILAPAGGLASLAIETLQLEVSVESGRLLYAWGYCPYEGWAQGSVSLREWVTGALVVSNCQLQRGVAVELALAERARWFDEATGWFWIGPRLAPLGDQCVLFADGCVAALSGSEITALFLRPGNWQELSRTLGRARAVL